MVIIYREIIFSEGYLLTRKDEIENNEMIDFENWEKSFRKIFQL